jgi:hypothetical protein
MSSMFGDDGDLVTSRSLGVQTQAVGSPRWWLDWGWSTVIAAIFNSVVTASDSSCALPAAVWMIVVNASVIRVRMSPATVLLWVKAVSSVSVTWVTASSVSVPLCADRVGMVMRTPLKR